MSESKVPPQPLSPDEARLLVYAACCVIAADGTIAQKERDALLAAMHRIGIPHDPKAMNAHVVAVCKQIYKEGVSACEAEAARQVAGASSSLKAALSSLTAELPWADGKATLEEIDFFGTVLESASHSAADQSVSGNQDGFELGPESEDTLTEASVVKTSQPISVEPASTLGATVVLVPMLLMVILPGWATVMALRTPQADRRVAESAPSDSQRPTPLVAAPPSRPPAEPVDLAVAYAQDNSLQQNDSQREASPAHGDAVASTDSVRSMQEDLRETKAELAELKKLLEDQKAKSPTNKEDGSQKVAQQPANRATPQLAAPTERQGKSQSGQSQAAGSIPAKRQWNMRDGSTCDGKAFEYALRECQIVCTVKRGARRGSVFVDGQPIYGPQDNALFARLAEMLGHEAAYERGFENFFSQSCTFSIPYWVLRCDSGGREVEIPIPLLADEEIELLRPSFQQLQQIQQKNAADKELRESMATVNPETRTFRFGVSKWVRKGEYSSFIETIQATNVNEARDICIGRHSTPDARGEMPSIRLE